MDNAREYLTKTVPRLIELLGSEDQPKFGIMTAQHMLEHLIWVTKSSVKDYGAPPESLTDKQMGFKNFILKGAHFEHRPSDKTRADLEPPRLGNLEEASKKIPEAIDRLYAHNDDHVFYNPMMGILTFEEMETFHASHFKYHLEKQFGLSLEK